MEKKTVRKWFWAWDFEKEEQWLNTMANSGWLLDGVGWCKFRFVACEPGTYTVRLESGRKMTPTLILCRRPAQNMLDG